MWDYFFGNAISATVTIMMAASIYLFFKGKEGSDQRKIAGYCFGFAILLSFIADIYDRHEEREACRRGDNDACMKVDIREYEDEMRQESYR